MKKARRLILYTLSTLAIAYASGVDFDHRSPGLGVTICFLAAFLLGVLLEKPSLSSLPKAELLRRAFRLRNSLAAVLEHPFTETKRTEGKKAVSDFDAFFPSAP